MRTPRDLQQLVDGNVRRWMLSARNSAAQPRTASVALSRMPGSGGAELGQRVAERLGCSFFGIEIVDWIARERNVQRELVAGLDEQVRTAIDRYVIDALRPFKEDDYLRQVVRTVTTIAERGSAVFLGRGAVFILPPERALRVLVTAPLELRVERVAKAQDLDADEARHRILREEETRREFHRHHFGTNADDAEHYDLMVNAGTLGIDVSVDLVVKAWQQKFGARGRSVL